MFRCLMLFSFLLAATVWADEPETLEIKPQRLHKQVQLTGNWASAETAEIRLDFKHINNLKIETALPDGSTVKTGDVIIKFNREEYDRQLKQRELKYSSDKLAFEQAQLNHKLATSVADMDLARQERQLEELKTDHQYFLEVLHPLQIAELEQSMKSSEGYLEDQREELRQLERMYTEDDLVEESEELVLRRTKRQLEQSEFFYNSSRLRSERQLQVFIPRGLVNAKEDHDRQLKSLLTGIETAKLQRAKLDADFEIAKLEFENATRDWDEFRVESEKLRIVAPTDGLVYYGKAERGAWTGTRKYHPKDAAANETIIATICKPGVMQVAAAVAEADRGLLATGQISQVNSPVAPLSPIRGSIQTLSEKPAEDGKFNALVSVAAAIPGVWPGMSANVTVTAYDNPTAIAVPPSAIFSDDSWEHYVYVWRDGKANKVVVQRGLATNELVEIKSGLAAGDRVLTKKPE